MIIALDLDCDLIRHAGTLVLANATVHQAAANDFNFRNRAARGSVCNGLFAACGFVRPYSWNHPMTKLVR
jgi:hypothetical protein